MTLTRLVLAVSLVCLAPYGFAAPSTEATESPAAERAAQKEAVDANASPKTIQLLLELQSSNPTLESGERPAAALGELPTRARGSAVAPGSDTRLVAAPGFGAEFDGSRAMKEAPAAAAIDWRSAGGNGSTTRPTSDRPGHAVESSEGDVDIKAVVPPGVIGFVRDNRELVLLGSLAVLGLVWVGASAASQQRR